MQIETVDKETLYERMRDETKESGYTLNTWQHSSGRIFEGFSFFRPGNIRPSAYSRRGKRFIIAHKGMDAIQGVVLLYAPWNQDPYWGISFVDVHKEHQSKGLMQELFAHTNQLFRPDDVVVGTKPTEEGLMRKAHIYAKKLIVIPQYFEDRTQFYEQKRTATAHT